MTEKIIIPVFFLALSLNTAQAREILIQGKVFNSNSRPVKNATVYPLNNPNDIVFTDDNGAFDLKTEVHESINEINMVLGSKDTKFQRTIPLVGDKVIYNIDWQIEQELSIDWYVVGKPIDREGNTPENWVAFYKNKPLREEDESFVLGPLSSTHAPSVRIDVAALTDDGMLLYGSDTASFSQDEFYAMIVEVKRVEKFPADISSQAMSILNHKEINISSQPNTAPASSLLEEKNLVPGEIVFIDGPVIGDKIKKNGLVIRYVSDNKTVEELTDKEAFFYLVNNGFINSRGRMLDKIVIFLNDITTDPVDDIKRSITNIFDSLNKSDVEAVQKNFSENYWGDSFFRSYEQIPDRIKQLLGITQGMKYNIEIESIEYDAQKGAYESVTNFSLEKEDGTVHKKGVIKSLFSRDDDNALRLVKISGIRFRDGH